MKKIAIFLNGKHTKRVLRIQSGDVSFPFIQKSKTSSDSKVEIFAADNGFTRILSDNIKYSKLHLFGDFDSISDTHLKKAHKDENIVVDIFAKEKTISDFGCILDHILNTYKGTQPLYIEIHGGLGNSFDHEYANIKEAENFLSKTHGGIIVFQGELILSTLPFALKHPKNTTFSLFSNSTEPFSIINGHYSGSIELLRPSHGISNYIEQQPLIIEKEPSNQIITMIVR